jgi:hypothetical protein
MSGYSSKQEVMTVIRRSIENDSAGLGMPRDPADYNLELIFRKAFYPRNPGYGAESADEWTAALTAAYRGLTKTARDYSVCAETIDGLHVLVAGVDHEWSDTHVSIQCRACGTTTGYPIADIRDRLEWD